MMKRILLMLSLIATVSATSMAQVGEHRSELAVGAGAGYVMSTMGFTPRVPQSQHGGVIAGVAARYTSEKYFNSICAIAAEVNIARIGWKENILDINDQHVVNALTGTTEQYQRDMTYLQVPVFARLGWGRERSGFQFFFQAGPQMGFFLGESTTTNFEIDHRSSERVSQIVAQDSMAVEHRFDYGIAVGLGLEYSHRRLGHFLLEGRYYYGLGDIYGNTKRDYFARSNFGNIVVKLTYLIDIQKTINPKIK